VAGRETPQVGSRNGGLVSIRPPLCGFDREAPKKRFAESHEYVPLVGIHGQHKRHERPDGRARALINVLVRGQSVRLALKRHGATGEERGIAG
jgi:hypothetical protein